MCHIQPLSVTRNATFVDDVDDVSFRDIKADELGTLMKSGQLIFLSSSGVE